MKNVNFDVYEYIINLVKQGYDVDSISRTLNLEKSYVVSMLRRIRSDIVSSMDEESFYLITMIDVLLKRKSRMLLEILVVLREIKYLICYVMVKVIWR